MATNINAQHPTSSSSNSTTLEQQQQPAEGHQPRGLTVGLDLPVDPAKWFSFFLNFDKII
jgi:hypothetical protein